MYNIARLATASGDRHATRHRAAGLLSLAPGNHGVPGYRSGDASVHGFEQIFIFTVILSFGP